MLLPSNSKFLLHSNKV